MPRAVHLEVVLARQQTELPLDDVTIPQIDHDALDGTRVWSLRVELVGSIVTVRPPVRLALVSAHAALVLPPVDDTTDHHLG